MSCYSSVRVNNIDQRDSSGRHAMNHNDIRGVDRAAGIAFGENGESIAEPALSAFVILPMSWVYNSCQTTANVQQALYLLARQQAEVAVRAVQCRRHVLFARGVHLWN